MSTYYVFSICFLSVGVDHFLLIFFERFVHFFQSTYCNTLLRHCEALRRTVHVVNLDPAAESFEYEAMAGELFEDTSSLSGTRLL